jgi:hypothetical protein
VKIEVGKTYLTRGGGSVRVLCVDRQGTKLPVVGLMSSPVIQGEVVMTYTKEGTHHIDDSPSQHDLMPPVEKFSFTKYVNVFRHPDKPGEFTLSVGYMHNRETAERCASVSSRYVATVPIHIDGVVPEGK